MPEAFDMEKFEEYLSWLERNDLLEMYTTIIVQLKTGKLDDDLVRDYTRAFIEACEQDPEIENVSKSLFTSLNTDADGISNEDKKRLEFVKMFGEMM